MINPIRRAKGARKAISIVAVLVLLVALLPAVPAMAGQVGNVSVTADNLKAGATGVNYTVAFDATSGLEPGDEITIVFPTGYDVTNFSVTGITYDGKTYQPAGTSSLGNIIRIGVPAGLTVPAGGNVAVEFAGVKNPTRAGSYKFAVRTTVDTTTAYGSITIEPAEARKIVITEPQNGAKVVANQVVPIKLAVQDNYGNPTTVNSDLTVTFDLTESGGSTADSAKLYKDSAATQELTDKKLVIAAGNTGGTAYLKDTEAESVTIAVTSEPALTPEPQSITITVDPYGTLAKLVFTQKPTQPLTAGAPGDFTVQLQDAYGNAVPAGTGGVKVTLTASGANAATVRWSDNLTQDPQNKLKATGTIAQGQSELSFTFGDTKASDKVTITASSEGLASATAEFKIVPGSNAKLVVNVTDAFPTTEEVEINSGQRTAVTIEAQDQYDNPVPQATNLEVSLSTNSETGNAKFYADTTSDTAITTATIPAGKSSVTVYYYDKLRPEDGVQKNITITATASNLTRSAPVTLVGPRPDKLEVVGDDSVEVNLRLPLTIKLLDQYGQPYTVAQDTTVNLTDGKDGEFYTSLVGGTSVPSVTIVAGKSEATVYYRPKSVGTNTVTATANVAVGAANFTVRGTKTVTVRPAGQVANELSITAEPIKAGTTGAVTVKVTDQYGNPVAQGSDLVVTLKADSPTGKFYDKAQDGNEISTVTIAKDKSEATVYYYDTKAGKQKITVSAPGLDPAEGIITVVPAEPAKIAVGVGGSVVVNWKTEVTLTVVDQFGNAVTVEKSPLTLVLSSSSATGRFEDGSGKQITQVSIAAGQSSATAYYRDSTVGEVTITAKTTGLEGSAKLTVQPVPEKDTTPPGEVTDLVVSLDHRAGVFRIGFTTPSDEDLSQVVVYTAVYGTNDWDGGTYSASQPNRKGNILVLVPDNLVLGKDRVKFKVVTVDTSGNESQGVLVDNEGHGYPVVAGYLLTPGPDGWRTFSVPVRLAGGQALLGGVIDDLEAVEIAWKFDAAAQRWVQVTEENNFVEPLEAVYVKLRWPTLAVITPTSAPTSPPVRDLRAGWNLVGFTKPDNLEDALYSVRDKWSAAVSPAVNLQAWATTPTNATGVRVSPHEGYWVYMDTAGTLVGFSATPVTVDQYQY